MRLRQLHEAVGIYRFNEGDLDLPDVDPWQAADEADRVAVASGIRIGSNKQLTFLALDGGHVVGAVWSAFAPDYDSTEYVYDFDVAVAPVARASGLTSARTGQRLIEAALADYHEQSQAVDGNASVRCWVVNPKLARYLEQHYGFEPESHRGWSQDTPHMVYRG